MSRLAIFTAIKFGVQNMKRIFAIIAIVMVACLSLTGLLSMDYVAVAEGETDFSKSVVAKTPSSNTYQGTTYYGIKTIEEWKWVFDNIDKINERKNTLVIEKDLDFSKYTNIPALDYGSRQGDVIGSTSPMRFSIVGGKVVVDAHGAVRISNFIPTITGYSIKIDKRNLGFMNMFDGEVIRNLKFDSMKFTYAGKATDQVGGPLGCLVGTLLSGTIENVSFTNADLNVANFNGVVGGVVGKVINGTISATDFQGNIIATASNAKVGGMVGEIIMGEIDYTGKHNVNDIKIKDSYVVASIEGGKYAGGIIGNVGYSIYLYDETLTSLANITVQNVYAKLKKITVADTKGVPYGILGNANIEKEDVVLPPIGQEANPSTIVPIENVKFVNVISSDTTESKVLTQMPIIFPNTQVINGKTMPNADFAISANYSKFELGKVWIMPETDDAANQQLDLIYKYESKQVKAVIAGTPAGSSIAELSNGIVSFVKDSPIVMTMQPKDGIHLLKVKLLLKENATSGVQPIEIMLYEAKAFADQTFATADEFFDYYGKNETTVKYDYKNSKLTIPVTKNGDTKAKEYIVQGADGQKYNLFEMVGEKFKYDVTFEFYFADEQKVEAVNEYKISAEPVFLTDNKPTNLGDVVLMEQANANNNNTATVKPNGTKYFHNEIINVFVPETYSDATGLILDGVKVKSNAGEEYLTSESGRGWALINKDYSYQKDGVIIRGSLYKVQLNYLKNKLYDKDSVTIQFIFNGKKLGESLRFQVGKDGDAVKDLVYSNILSVQYFDENNLQVLDPRVYDSLTIKFTLGSKGQGYAFNMMDFADKKMYINVNTKTNKDEAGTDTKYEVTYDEVTKTFTTTKAVSFSAQTIVYVQVVQTVQNSVGLAGVTFNPPSLKLYNIPVLGKDGINIVGFATATLLYSDKDGARKLTVKTEADQSFGDVDISDIVKVGANGVVAEFTSIQGANIGVEIVKNTVDQTDAYKYYKLSSYKLNDVDYTFTYYDEEGFSTVGKIDMSKTTPTNIINVQFSTVEQQITVMPYVKDEAGQMVALSKDKVDKMFPYGNHFSFSRLEYVTRYEKDYVFDGWLMGSEGDPVVSDSFGGRADGKKEVRIILAPKVKITFNANKDFGSILIDGRKITTFEFDKRLYNDADKKLVFKVELLRGKKLIVEDNEKYTYDSNNQTITINISKLPALNQTNLEAGLLDIKVPLAYEDITLEFRVNNKHLDDKGMDITEKGGITTIYDGNQVVIGSFDPAYTDLNLKFDSRMYIEAQVNDGFAVTFYINEEVADYRLISRIENKYTLKLPEMTENTTITVEYKKSPEQTFHRIVGSKIEFGHIENGQFVKDSDVHEANIQFAFSVTGGNINANNIPHGTKVTVTFNDLNPKYEFYSWFNGKEGQPVESKSLIYVIDSIDDNYQITLRIVEKTYKVEVLLPELPSGDTATVTIRKPDGTVEDIPNSNVKFELVAKYGESVSLFFNPNINEYYEIDRWVVTGDANPSTAQTYTLGSIQDNYVIRVQVRKKKANVDIITDDLKIKHDMSYTGFATGYTKALLFEGNTKVKLTALPSPDAYFEKWIVKDADGVRDYSKDAEIVVDNEEGKTYEAVFQIKKYKITFINQDVYAPIFKGENPDTISHGKNIRIEFNVMAGYKIDKIIINGGEQVIPIGSVNAIDLYNIDKDQTIQVLYHKVDMTDSDKMMVTVAVIMLIVAVVVAVIVYILLVNSSIKQARKKRKDKSNRINVD